MKLEGLKKDYEKNILELKRKEDDENINRNDNGDKIEDTIYIIEINELKKDIEDKKLKIEQIENEIKLNQLTILKLQKC